MSTITVVFRRDKFNKNNEAPIHFRIIKNRKPSYIATGFMIEEKYWDNKNGRVKANFKNSARINAFLVSKLSELTDQVLTNETSQKSLTSKQLKEKIYGKDPTDLFKFAEEINEENLRVGRIGSYDRNKSILQKLKDYNKGKSLYFQEITPSYITQYQKYLSETVGNKVNTIHMNLKFIRKIFNDAIRLELIEYGSSPFSKVKLSLEKTHRIYLTEDELALIEHYPSTPGTRLELHRDMFVFAAYTGGLRVSDVLSIKWKDFDGQYLHIKIRKTGSQLSIKIPNTALDIIAKYKQNRKPEQYIFPMLPDDLNINDPKLVDATYSSATAYINKNLKIIEEKIELKKHISFHTSRHTWATRALRKGITIDKVSKLMGHSAIKETQIYAKIVNEELDKAMDVFNI